MVGNEGDAALVWRIRNYGSADIAWRLGSADLTLHTTYVGDGLNGLMRAAVDLRNGSRTAYTGLEGEPGGTLLLFAQPGDRLYVQIIQFGVLRTWDRSNLVWSGHVPTDEFIGAVDEMATDLLNRHGEDEYTRLWGGIPFPMDIYRDLHENATSSQP